MYIVADIFKIAIITVTCDCFTFPLCEPSSQTLALNSIYYHRIINLHHPLSLCSKKTDFMSFARSCLCGEGAPQLMLRTYRSLKAYCTTPVMKMSSFWPVLQVMEHQWNEIDRGKPTTRRKTCPSATLSTTNPTWTDPGSNTGLRSGRPATNRLSHGTVLPCSYLIHTGFISNYCTKLSVCAPTCFGHLL
jgi:hypothetical protein